MSAVTEPVAWFDFGLASVERTFLWFACGCLQSRHPTPICMVCSEHSETFAHALGFEAIIFIRRPHAQGFTQGVVSQLSPIVQRGLAAGFKEIRALVRAEIRMSTPTGREQRKA